MQKVYQTRDQVKQKKFKAIVDMIVIQAVIDLGNDNKSIRQNAYSILVSTDEYGLAKVKEAAKSKNLEKKKLALWIIAEVECHACGMG